MPLDAELAFFEVYTERRSIPICEKLTQETYGEAASEGDYFWGASYI